MITPDAIDRRRLLFVEGRDEVNFFNALLKNMGIASIEVVNVGGKFDFKKKLRIQAARPDFKSLTSIGIVRDADDNAQNTFISIRDALTEVNLPVPTMPLVSTQTVPRVTVMIMPPENVGTNRMLEDLCFAAVANDPAVACVDDYLACLQTQGIELSQHIIAKAKIHAFLASRTEPDKRLGEAALAGYFPWQSPIFDPVKTFLAQVASESE